MAVLLVELGEYARAKSMLEDAVATLEKHLGAQHPELAMGINTDKHGAIVFDVAF